MWVQSSTIGIIEVGDLVRHYGTRQWGLVLEVRGPNGVPWRDGSQELRVRRYVRTLGTTLEGWGDQHGEGWW